VVIYSLAKLSQDFGIVEFVEWGGVMGCYDLIVVGAGPGGLGACLRARELGLSVALIERRTRLSPLTRACSEGLLYNELYNGDAAHIDVCAGRIGFKNNPFSFSYSGLVREVPYFANMSPAGHMMKIVRHDGNPIHLVYDKALFLEENLEAALSAGVTYLPGRSVTGIDATSEKITVAAGNDVLTGCFLIAADGHNSACAELAGFNTDRTSLAILSVACWHITGFEPSDPAHLHLIEGCGGPSMVCLCPRSAPGHYSVMISGFNSEKEFAKHFTRIRTRSVLSPHFTPEFAIVRRLGCVLNLRTPITNPCGHRVFIIGDAAWMGQTSNTHAALGGVHAVECCARALNDNIHGEDAYEPYRTWWQQQYVDNFRMPGANFLEELSGEEIDALFADMPDHIPGSLEPTAAATLLGRFFKDYMPKLAVRDPALAGKIAAIQQIAPQDAWDRRRSQR
jgi:flavin-dependent dehydrogenase